MVRIFCSLILVLAFVCCFDASKAQAQISRDNPYRSFNISGVNYGSMRWEDQHRHQTQATQSTRILQPASQVRTQGGILGFRRFRR